MPCYYLRFIVIIIIMFVYLDFIYFSVYSLLKNVHIIVKQYQMLLLLLLFKFQWKWDMSYNCKPATHNIYRLS